MPFTPSPGRPKIVSTLHSMSRSTSRSAVRFAMYIPSLELQLPLDPLSAADHRRCHCRVTWRKRLIPCSLAHVTPHCVAPTCMPPMQNLTDRHGAHSLRPGRFNPVSSHRTQPSHPHMLDRENLCDTWPAKRLWCHDETLPGIAAAFSAASCLRRRWPRPARP